MGLMNVTNAKKIIARFMLIGKRLFDQCPSPFTPVKSFTI